MKTPSPSRLIRNTMPSMDDLAGPPRLRGDNREPSTKLRVEDLNAVNEALLIEIRERKRAEQVARGQTEALAKTLDLLAAEPELDSFVGQVLKALTEQLGARSGSFWLFDAVQGAPVLRLDYDYKNVESVRPTSGVAALLKATRHEVVVSQNGPIKSVILKVFDDIATAPIDEAYRKELQEKGIQTLLAVPLVSGEDFIGSFTLHDTDQRSYGPEELELAQALAQQAVLAIQLTRLAEHRRKAAVLEERNRIAREIHDTLAQSFTGILLQLRVAQRIADQDPEESKLLIEHVTDLAHDGLLAARRSVWDLQPESLEYIDIFSALKRYVARLDPDSGAKLEVHVLGTPRDVPPSIGMDFVRIAQEAIANALRHARATTIIVDVVFKDDRITLCVQDDGKGFDLERHAESAGFGIIGMNQRAERLGGRLTVTTSPGNGTEVAIAAPITSGVLEEKHEVG